MSFRGCERNWSDLEGMKEVEEDGNLKEKVKYCSDRDDESKEQPSTPLPAFRRIIERFNGSFGLVNEPVNGLA
ncbi:hypothetical protein M0R45_036122 [Rubus argutus]|uniref:Uncharacterized protein n=1 Tax=Rubus argutus TaxID=59490 RepID=A0AAW1VYT9_RUBAR